MIVMRLSIRPDHGEIAGITFREFLSKEASLQCGNSLPWLIVMIITATVCYYPLG